MSKRTNPRPLPFYELPSKSSHYLLYFSFMVFFSILCGCAHTTDLVADGKASSTDPMVVRLTGENFRWQIRYAGGDGILDTKDDVVTTKNIHIPSHRDVHFELMSNDLLYTFTLEEKGLNEMAVPGMTFTFDVKSAEEGTLGFLSSHMCGSAYPDLNGEFVVESESSFHNWLNMKKKEGSLDPGNAAADPGILRSFDQIRSVGNLEIDPPILGGVPEFELTDQLGEVFSSIDLTGKVWVANFIFTRCPSSCPLQMARMKQIQDKIFQHPGAYKTALISVTVDPDYDQPSILEKHAENFNVNQAHWKFLTGSRDEIWNLSKDGFKLAAGKQPGPDSTLLFHSTMMVLVDDLGRIRGYYDGITNEGEEALMADLDKVLNEEHPDWIAVPSSIMNPPWLNKMQKEQFQSAAGRPVFYDFRFSDRLEESGIDFRHHISDDAGITYKANHYDHGNGMAIADIDLDGLYDIYFVNQIGSNRLYRNLGGGKFEDVTDRAGVAVGEAPGVSASFADIDNDGDADLFVTTVRGGNFLFENDGSGRFQDITEKAGLTHSGHSSGALFFDYNRDGLLDLFLTNVGSYTLENKVSVIREGKTYAYYEGMTDAFAGHLKPERSEASILYQSLGNRRFKDVSKRMRLTDLSWSGDASMLDANEDGWPDLYVLNMQGHDHYYENNRGEYFSDRTEEVFPKTPWGSMGIKVFDHNNDGLMDIYVTDMHSDMDKRIGPETEKYKPPKIFTEYFTQAQGKSIYGNAFFENRGGGAFREISDRLGVETYWPWGPSVGDLNADGYEDIFVASGMNYPWRYAVNKVLLNIEGKEYIDAEFLLGIEPRHDGKTATPWFSLDCSGKDQKHIDCQFQKGPMTVWGALGSRSSAIFDLDNDGDLDIVTNDFNSAPMVLVSNLTEKKEIHFLKVNLVGATSNKSGIGATVKVSAGGQTYTRYHDGKSGYLSQSLIPIYFGLGDAVAVDRIEVLWPSGKRQVEEGPIKTNTLIELKEE